MKKKGVAVMHMMRFDMTTEEGREAEFRAVNGGKYHDVLWDLAEWLRTQYKHNNKVWAQECRDRVREIMDDHGAHLWGE